MGGVVQADTGNPWMSSLPQQCQQISNLKAASFLDSLDALVPLLSTARLRLHIR
jgi:hypothetical protein